MIRENGRKTMIGQTMIGKVYWGVLASTLLAVAFATGCNSTNASPVLTPITTVTAMAPFSQNQYLTTQFASPLTVQVTTVTTPGTAGTPVVGVTVTFTAPSSGAGGGFGSVGGPNFATATTDSNGMAMSPNFYSNSTEGTYNIIASANGSLTSTALFNMFNTGTPGPIAVSGGTPQSTSISTQFQNTLSVTVTDSTGASVGQGLPVTFTASGANAGTFADTLTDTTTVITNSNGLATSTPVIAGATPGSFIVTATTISPDALSVTFDLWNTIVPAAITPAGSSTPQTATINSPFAPLTVTVVDGTTPTPVPVAGAVITFTAPSFTVNSMSMDSAPSGTFPTNASSVTALTDVNGVATAPLFTANGLAGTYNVTATVVVKQGTSLSATFALTNQ
jgi:hypothetical protein